MFCSYCGNKIADDARFCSYCGKGVVSIKQVQPEQHEPQTLPIPPEIAPRIPIRPESVRGEFGQPATPVQTVSVQTVSAQTVSVQTEVTQIESAQGEAVQDTPVQQIEENNSEQAVEDPVEQAVEAPVEQAVEEPVEQTIEEPVGQTVEEPVGQTIEQSVEEPVEKPVEQANESTVQQQALFPPPGEDDVYTPLSPEQQGVIVYQTPPEEKREPERKYTLTHLLMCLASTAVFAIAAGVFAGLYFSGL